MDHLEAMAKAVKAAREEAGLTQDALAKLSGITARFIQHIESGQKAPSMTTIFKLSRALGLKPGDLIEPSWKVFKKES